MNEEIHDHENMTADMDIDGDIKPLDKSSTYTAKDSLPWVEKYRPNSLSEMIAHDEIISICEPLFS